MPNPNGTPANLHPGNTNAVRSGVYSRTGRVLAPRAEEIARALMGAPHVVPLDSIAAEEIGAVLAQIEAIDADLEHGGRRDRKTLLEHRARLTRELRTWLREFRHVHVHARIYRRLLAADRVPVDRPQRVERVGDGGRGSARARSGRSRSWRRCARSGCTRRGTRSRPR